MSEYGHAVVNGVKSMSFKVKAEETLLEMCNEYATILTLRTLPLFTTRLLGDTGFGALVRLFREFAKEYVKSILGRCCNDPLEVLEYMASLNMNAGGRFSMLPRAVKRFTGYVDVYFELEPRLCSSSLCSAPFLGLVAGIIEAWGARPVVMRRQRKITGGGYTHAVYPVREEPVEGTLVVRVEKIAVTD